MSGFNIKAVSDRYTVKKDDITMILDSHGAKLLALFKNGCNVLFYDSDDIAHSGVPLCFPSFGPLKNGKFIYEKKSYPMGQHGFIRDLDFIVVEKGDSLICSASSTEKTEESYPFKFEMKAVFKLIKNGVRVKLSMKNKSKNPMPVAPGVHPYFTVTSHTTISISSDSTEGNNNLHNYDLEPINESGVLRDNGDKRLLISGAPDFHLKGHSLDSVDIHSIGVPNLNIKYDNDVFNRLTIWRKNPVSPFICVEPAYVQNGINDCPIMVKSGESFETEFEITIA